MIMVWVQVAATLKRQTNNGFYEQQLPNLDRKTGFEPQEVQGFFAGSDLNSLLVTFDRVFRSISFRC